MEANAQFFLKWSQSPESSTSLFKNSSLTAAWVQWLDKYFLNLYCFKKEKLARQNSNLNLKKSWTNFVSYLILCMELIKTIFVKSNLVRQQILRCKRKMKITDELPGAVCSQFNFMKGWNNLSIHFTRLKGIHCWKHYWFWLFFA